MLLFGFIFCRNAQKWLIKISALPSIRLRDNCSVLFWCHGGHKVNVSSSLLGQGWCVLIKWRERDISMKNCYVHDIMLMLGYHACCRNCGIHDLDLSLNTAAIRGSISNNTYLTSRLDTTAMNKGNLKGLLILTWKIMQKLVKDPYWIAFSVWQNLSYQLEILWFSLFIRPFEKTGRIMPWQCPSVRLSVRPSVRVFFNMLWDINLKLGIYIK